VRFTHLSPSGEKRGRAVLRTAERDAGVRPELRISWASQLGIKGKAEEKKMERESRTLERRAFSVASVGGGESHVRAGNRSRRMKESALSSAPKKSI
jgi:hypothetical protein